MPDIPWTGPNPTLPVEQGGPWGGSLDWNEARNWNNQPAGGHVPTNGDYPGFNFSPGGDINGPCAFYQCTVGSYSGTPPVVRLTGVNCTDGGFLAATNGQLDVKTGSGVLVAFMQGTGLVGSSEKLTGGTFKILNVTSGEVGSVVLQQLENFPTKHIGNRVMAAIAAAISGFSPLQVGRKSVPVGDLGPGETIYDVGYMAQLDVFTGGAFTGGVTAEYNYGLGYPFDDELPSLNLKSNAAAGAAGEPINLRGGKVSFAIEGGHSQAWLGHPINLDVGGFVGPGYLLGGGIPLVIYLPDARAAGIRNTGNLWNLKCAAHTEQLCGTGDLTNGFVGRNDSVVVKPTGSLIALKKGEHFYGHLSFEAGGKVQFSSP